jgi:hypothetical protein
MERREKLAKYHDLVAGFEDLAIKGKASAYTALNGNMFSFLSPDGLWAFRLSDQDRKAYESAFGPSEVIQYNSVMRGYVEIRDALAEDADALKDWFARSLANARTLKPKPTKKR